MRKLKNIELYIDYQELYVMIQAETEIYKHLICYCETDLLISNELFDQGEHICIVLKEKPK